MEKKKRGSFTGEIGFVLAAAGSAVGLGNLWRFPYLAAQYGGGIFILVYWDREAECCSFRFLRRRLSFPQAN